MESSEPTSRFRQQGAHALFTTAVSVVLGLALSMLVARTLGPAGKGVLDLASATAALFALVLGASLNAALTHHLARQGTRPAGLVAQLGLWSIVAGVVTAAGLAIRPDVSARTGLLPGTQPSFWIGFAALSVAVGIWASGLRGMLIGQQAVILANRIDVASKAVLFVGFAALALRSITSPQAFAIVGVSITTVLAIALLIALPGPTAPAAGTWRTLLALAVPIHGTNIVHFLNQRADVFFIQAFHGSTAVGLYALAVSLAQCILLLSSALAQPLLPQISAAPSAAAAREATLHTCRLFTALGLVAALAVALGCRWIVPLVFGRDFSASLPSLMVLLPGMIAFGLTNILVSHFVGRGHSRINWWISLGTLLVTAIGNFSLTRQLGAMGAAITSSVAYALSAMLSLWFFHRENGAPLFAAVCPTSTDWREAAGMLRRFRL